MSLHVETIAIGDELLTGIISDTNSTFVADCLFREGIRLVRSTLVSDSLEDIKSVLTECGSRADVAVCFGGLGPTSDDRTAEGVIALIGGGLSQQPLARDNLVALFQRTGRKLTETALKQTYYPERATPLSNSVGLAPGFSCRIGRCQFYFLPGVPREMKEMFSREVFPTLIKQAGTSGGIRSRVWRCIGLPESDLQVVMNPVEARLPSYAWIGYRTHFPENHLTLYYRRDSGGDRDALFESFKSEIDSLLTPWCYSTERLSLEEVVVSKLRGAGLTLALAESCTGGMVVSRLVSVAGASDVVWGGAACYQVAAKEALLGVGVQTPIEAVSADCTRRLAQAVLNRSGASMGIAVTGYLGPTGGTADCPVGTVFICALKKEPTAIPFETKLTLPPRTRAELQWATASYVLQAILTHLNTHP